MNEHASLDEQIERFVADYHALRDRLLEAVVGQEEAVDAVLTSLFAGGHALIEGEPGVGKTLLAGTLAKALSVKFRRLHFTPDLMSADVVGTYVVMESHGRRRFEMIEGPIFANVFLAEEIQRAPPKTQAALLEAMSERAVTLGNQTYDLPSPHIVVATRGVDDDEGVYALPRTQLDRFLLSSRMAPPTEEQIQAILRQNLSSAPSTGPTLNAERLLAMTQLTRHVEAPDEAVQLAARLVFATRPDEDRAAPLARQHLRYGAGPRAALALMRAAQVQALAEGRVHVAREDLLRLALPVLGHRVELTFAAAAEGVQSDEVLADVIAFVR